MNPTKQGLKPHHNSPLAGSAASLSPWIQQNKDWNLVASALVTVPDIVLAHESNKTRIETNLMVQQVVAFL